MPLSIPFPQNTNRVAPYSLIGHHCNYTNKPYFHFYLYFSRYLSSGSDCRPTVVTMDADDEFGDFSGADADALTAAVIAAERSAAQRQQNSTPLAGRARPQTATTTTSADGGINTKQPTTGPVGATTPVVQPAPQKSIRTGGPSAIIVNARQKGNPVLSHIKNVPWEYGDIEPDYVVGQTACAFFLSLKYHRLHPEYIYNRIKALGPHQYNLRILLVMIDIENHQPALLELTKTCLLTSLTLILSWTSAEAGRYLETYKAYEHTPPISIREKHSSDYPSRMVDVCTAVRSVNKVDAVGLVTTFGSVRAAMNASKEEVVLVQGMGEKKAGRWVAAVREPFRFNPGSKSTGAGHRKGKEKAGGGDGGRIVAEKLGIGPQTQTQTRTGDGSRMEPVSIDDDEEMALVEAERTATGAGSGTDGNTPREGEKDGKDDGSNKDSNAGIMKALERLRTRDGGP